MSDTVLGMDGDKEVKIKLYDRLRGSFVIGSTGAGKSILLQNMLLSDIRQGLGVGLLDPTGDLIDKVISGSPENRLDDIILLDPLDSSPFPLNIFACPDPSNPAIFEQTVEAVMGVFSKVFGASMETPRLNQYLRNITKALIGTPYTMVEIPELLIDRSFRNRVIPHPSSFWRSFDRLPEREQLDRSESTLDRVDALVENEIIKYIVGQAGTIDFREIIDTNKILLVRLYADREQMTAVLGSIIIGQLMLAALSRYNIPENRRRQFNLYADEFSYFATPAMGILLTQARKYKIATTVATQVLTQMSETIQATVLQAGSKIVFAVTPPDAEILSGVFDTTPALSQQKIIARDVFRFMAHHSDKTVQEFWNAYIRRWQRATGENIEEVIKTYNARTHLDNDFVIINRYRASSEGGAAPDDYLYANPEAYLDPWRNVLVEYDPRELQEVLDAIEAYLYRSQQTLPKIDEITEQIGEFPIQYSCIDIYESRARRFLEKVAVYLGFPTYLSLMYEFTSDESVRPLTQEELRVIKYEKDLYLAFIHTFTLAVKALHADPIYVDPPKELRGSQTFIDRRKAIENILTHLGVGEAMVKTPAGEWLIHTKPGEGIQGDFDEKKEQVFENTRERYGKTRAEVDQEMAERIKPDEMPPTQRKHILR